MRVKRRDPYATLGVARDADQAAIDAAFRSKAKRAHPDAGGTREAFETLKAAHLVLRDPGRREKFDATGDDEPEIDNAEAQALALIAIMLARMLEGPFDPSVRDVVADLRGMLGDELAEVGGAIRQGREEKRRANAIRARLKGGAGREALDAILASRLRDIARGLAKAQEAMGLRLRAVEILKDARVG